MAYGTLGRSGLSWKKVAEGVSNAEGKREQTEIKNKVGSGAWRRVQRRDAGQGDSDMQSRGATSPLPEYYLQVVSLGEHETAGGPHKRWYQEKWHNVIMCCEPR